MQNFLPSAKILGTTISTASKSEILEYIIKRIENSKKSTNKFYIVTPNPEILAAASSSNEFQDILNGAAVSLPDGIGVLAAGKILNKGIKGRITGIDCMLELCRQSAKKAYTIGLLGGRDGVAEKTADCLREKYPDLRVIFASDVWEAKIPEDRISNIEYRKIQNSKLSHIDILFVAFGAPKQEEWIAKNLSNIDVTAAMGVGGAFDYISGKVPRAPKFVRSIGMEWGFRLVVQPWRLKRQLALPVFTLKVVQEWFKSR